MTGKHLGKITQQLLLISYILKKQKQIYPAHISKHNLTREKQIIPLMILNKEKEGWNYLAVKKYLHYILHGITSKHIFTDFYCLNAFILLE